MDLTQLLDVIRQHGDVAYAFLFANATSHSMIMVLFAGYAAHMGALDWGKLVLVCWAGSFIGDAVRFWIARRFGIGWLSSFPRVQRGIEKAARLANKHYLWIPLVHRYPNGVRNVAAFAFGLSSLSTRTFSVLNVIAAGIWSVAIVSAGYAFGQLSEKTMADAASGVGLAALVLFLALAWVLSNRLEQAVEATAATSAKPVVPATPGPAARPNRRQTRNRRNRPRNELRKHG